MVSKLFCKGLRSKCFQFCAPRGLCLQLFGSVLTEGMLSCSMSMGTVAMFTTTGFTPTTGCTQTSLQSRPRRLGNDDTDLVPLAAPHPIELRNEKILYDNNTDLKFLSLESKTDRRKKRKRQRQRERRGRGRAN